MTDDRIKEIAHRKAWRHKHSTDPHHSDTYTFNDRCLIDFTRAVIEAECCVPESEQLQRIYNWCEAYPIDIFTEPDWEEVEEKLGSTLLTQVSAANMRHVVEGIKKIREMLAAATKPAECRKVPEDSTVTVLPDGSAFGVISFPLPKDHWLYAEREYAPEAVEPTDLPAPILTHALRKEVIAAMRYAIRAATDCGKINDFDPDALVQNAVYALCGPYGAAAPKPAEPTIDKEFYEYAKLKPHLYGDHLKPAEPVAQEPVSFYIYKETAPRLGIPSVVIDSLPWVYDQDPSSGFSARLKVYLAPPDQSAEVERLVNALDDLLSDMANNDPMMGMEGHDSDAVLKARAALASVKDSK